MTQYRSLGPKELIKKGDECRHDSAPWHKVDASIGWTGSDFSCYEFRRRVHGKKVKPEFRFLEAGEIVQEGDEWLGDYGKDTPRVTWAAGWKIVEPYGKNKCYRRKVAKEDKPVIAKPVAITVVAPSKQELVSAKTKEIITDSFPTLFAKVLVELDEVKAKLNELGKK